MRQVRSTRPEATRAAGNETASAEPEASAGEQNGVADKEDKAKLAGTPGAAQVASAEMQHTAHAPIWGAAPGGGVTAVSGGLALGEPDSAGAVAPPPAQDVPQMAHLPLPPASNAILPHHASPDLKVEGVLNATATGQAAGSVKNPMSFVDIKVMPAQNVVLAPGASQKRADKPDSAVQPPRSKKAKSAPWTDEEDEQLAKVVERYGVGDWCVVSSAMPGRSDRQCRDRYFNHVDTGVNRSPWTELEDAIIVGAHARLGNRWSSIVPLLSGRTANAIKNRFNATLLPRLRNPHAQMKRKRKCNAPVETLLAIHNPQLLQKPQTAQPQDGAAHDAASGNSMQPPNKPQPRRLQPPTEAMCTCGKMGFEARSDDESQKLPAGCTMLHHFPCPPARTQSPSPLETLADMSMRLLSAEKWDPKENKKQKT
jgi:hypothetical protein